MNFTLLWIDVLACGLTWLLTMAAFIYRIGPASDRMSRRGKWARAALLFIVGVVPPLVVLGAFVFGASVLKYQVRVERHWFGYACSLLACFVVGAIVIMSLGRRAKPGMRAAAAMWPRTGFVAAFVLAVALGYMTLANMDLTLRARCAIIGSRVGSVYLAAAPAIVSEAENAAPLYEQAFAALRDSTEHQVDNPPTGRDETFDPHEQATIDFLKQQAGTLALLRKAASLPGCRFDEDLEGASLDRIMPSLNQERNVANVLGLDARQAIADGDTLRAISDARAVLRMSRQFAGRPMLVSGLIGIGVAGLGEELLERVLPTIQTPAELDVLNYDELPTLDRAFQQSLRGEEQLGLTLYSSMPSAGPEAVQDAYKTPPAGSPLASLPGAGGMFFRVFYLDLDAYLDMMQQMQSLALLPYYRAKTLPPLNSDTSHGDIFNAILQPSFNRLFEVKGKSDAAEACARTAIAMMRCRLDHGSLPTRLDALMPQYLEHIPTDPFNGQPLRLAVRNGAWIIYSVGPDGEDDEGKPMGYDKHHPQSGDVIFTLKSALSTQPS